MNETVTSAPSTPPAQGPGLIARVIGVIFSPRETYAAVAAQPRSLGVILVCAAVFIAAQTAFLLTETGREIVLDQQVRAVEAFGVTVTDQMYTQMEQGLERSLYINPVFTLASVPLINAIVAGLLMVVFTMLLGGAGTFKQVFAISAHASVIVAVQQIFSTPLSYASGRMAGANLGVFVPMLEETSAVTLFLNAIDLFLVWWMVSLAIGLGVLYRRRTGPIAIGLLSVYVIIALVLAFARSGS